MITAYACTDGTLTAHTLNPGDALPHGTVWVDLAYPTGEEREHAAMLVNAVLPTREDMDEIQVSSRLYESRGIFYMTSLSIAGGDTDTPRAGPITFVLVESLLVTVRYIDSKFIAFAAQRAQHEPALAHAAPAMLTLLLEAVVERAADVLEVIAGKVDALSRAIFAANAGDGDLKRRSQGYRTLLRDVGRTSETLGKLREMLGGFERLAVFATSAVPSVAGDKPLKLRVRTVVRDLQSLALQTDTMLARLSFLLDATLGLISVEQNDIVRIFTVGAVAFFPPTLIGTIYGMNFKDIPELGWSFGYPYALVLMVTSALLPLVYFRHKGWL